MSSAASVIRAKLPVNLDTECNMDNHRARKRKIDKDGFVTPATPDIPKTSCQYVDYSSSGHEDYKDTGFLGFSRSEETDDLQSLSYYSKADAQSQLSHQQEMKNPCKDDDGQDSIQQLMKDLIRESGCIIEQWSQVFRCSCQHCMTIQTRSESKCCKDTNILDGKMEEAGISCITEHDGFQANCLNEHVLETSYYEYLEEHGPNEQNIHDGSENFENFCLSRLDQLSEKAGTIEESLKQQKNKLCHRLRGLTNTLQKIEN